ncbi:PGC-1 and ERR-induced regulator in muscle protein 1 [Dromaius novaehollandiae]|uniref:PGC-1 and ERR-induced regulator in muscle protein 1 n=1 Tax=Dromaius novaehollandiae TaxID=8790 RepID=UPI00311E1585
MDNFEYSIQLSDRDWAEFYLASEECSLMPAALATAEEQCLSDIEQGDGVPGRDCRASANRQTAARAGSGPGPGMGSSPPRGVPRDASPRRPAGGQLALPEVLSGSEDEMDLGSASRFRRGRDEPGHPRAALPMPSRQGRQLPCAPTAALAGPAGGAAESSPGQEAACETAVLRSASEEGAASSSRAMEPHTLAGGSAPAQEGGTGGEQPSSSLAAARHGPPGHSSSPALSAPLDGSARKRPSSAPCSEPGLWGPPSELTPSPALETSPQTAPRVPGSPGREDLRGEKAWTEPSSAGGSPEVVRPKTPAQPRKSRKQRGASAAEVTHEDREPAGAVAQGGLVPTKVPLSSPLLSRKSRGKEKAAKPGSEEAEQSKRPASGPGADKGALAVSTAPDQQAKETGLQLLGKGKVTKRSKPGLAGDSGVRDTVPPILARGAAALQGDACQDDTGKPLDPESVAVFGGDAAAQAHGEPAAKTPGALGPPCFAVEGSARENTLDVTWPEMYDYLFCDSQGEEEGVGNPVEGETIPLEREISLPELYEYFFNEPEGNRKKVKGKDRKRKKFSSLDRARLQNEDPGSTPVKESLVISVPEVYEHFFVDGPRNRGGWRGIFLTTPASEVKKAVGALKLLLQRPMHLIRGQVPAPHTLVRRGSGEKLPLVPLSPLGRGQARPEGLDMAVALTGRPEAPLALTHKDMCLVFCAFASWAVKTSDLQAPDAWKTMFLATFGTLSAIRYFRRQVREGHHQT